MNASFAPFLVILLAFAGLPAFSPDEETPSRKVVYETQTDSTSRVWRRAGEGISCQVVATEDEYRQLQEEIPPGLMCQRLGPLQIGDRFSRLTTSFGRPHRKLVDTDSQKVYVFRLKGEAPRAEVSAEAIPYLVVGAVRDTVVTLQLTGPPIDPQYPFSFSSIELGDAASRAAQLLGEPWTQEEINGMEGVVLWSYGPHSFSLEMKEERVYSIRLWWPGRDLPPGRQE